MSSSRFTTTYDFRALLLALIGLVYIATWPGTAVRGVWVAELVAPAVPKEVGRDGVLDVVVHVGDGQPIANKRADDDDTLTAKKSDKPVLAGARVRAFAILDGRAYAAAEAISDRDGRATLRDLPQAEHWIVAEADGHSRASQMVVVVAGARRLDLELGPEHALDLFVKDEQGAPIQGAEIEVRGPDPFPVGGRTNEEGRARVGRLGEGPYTVIARALGYEEVTKRRAPEGELATIVLGKQGALSIVVVAEDGSTPVAAARVLLASSALGGSVRVAETDKTGKVRIAGLDRGSYAVRAVSGTRCSPIDLGLVVSKGEDKSVQLALQPGLMITAHAVDASNEDDVKDARVTLAEGGLSPFPLDGVTDKRGRVALGPILLGSAATLSARAEGFVPKAAISIEEPPAGEVRIPLARGGSLVGKISDARGYAVDGATIRVVGTDLDGMPIEEDPSRWSFREAHFTAQLKGPSPLVPAGELGVMPGPVPAIPHGPAVGLSFSGGNNGGANAASAATGTPAADPWISGRDGTYRATPVTPGRVRIVVRHPQYVEQMSEVVLLESNKEVRLDVVLQRGGILEGRVADSRGRAVAGAHVTALATRGSLEHMTRTGTDGSFAFAALPDAVTLLVARDQDPTSIVARVEVSIPEGAKKSIEITLPDPRPALPVKVTDPRGTGIEQVQVSAVSLDPNEALRATTFTDARGRAELLGARGVALRVEVRAPGRAARVVDAAADLQELVVVLMPAESVVGEITTRHRRDPVVNAEVSLQTETGTRHARTNKEGVFTIGDVAAGPARLRIRAPGRAPDDRAIVIEDRGGRRATDLGRFELPEEGIVEGVVVDNRGDPIPGARVGKDSVPTYLPVGVSASIAGTMAVTDGKGRFKLGELGEGLIALEAYAADIGRARKTDVRVSAGRTTSDVKIVIARGEGASAREPVATGGVAITLGETVAGLEAAEVVVVAVVAGSEADRGGLQPNDIIVEIGGAKITSITEARTKLSGPIHDDVLVKVRRGERQTVLRVTREPVRR